jgi:Bacteriophage holin of superfamily 6 (Holin_LLH)
MTLLQILVNIILTLLLPIMIWVGYWVAQFQIQKMPQQQRHALDQFARMAVQYVEHEHKASPDKKTLARSLVSDLFKAFRLPVPTPDTLEIAVGSAFYEVEHLPSTLSSAGEKEE